MQLHIACESKRYYLQVCSVWLELCINLTSGLLQTAHLKKQLSVKSDSYSDRDLFLEGFTCFETAYFFAKVNPQIRDTSHALKVTAVLVSDSVTYWEK
jgi:hypothetical protein